MNNLYLTNSLNNKKEVFNPINPEKVSMYACGPTVYDNPHVGNARALVVFDLLFRILIEIERGDKSKISTINFIGNKNIRSNRLRDIIASEEDKFWKFLTNNTNFSERLINLDLRLLTNYYKSLGYYDIKVTSNSANLNKSGEIDLVYSIDEGTRYIVNKISIIHI